MTLAFARIFFFSCFISLGLSSVYAQTNIARASTATHSGGGQTIFGYGPDRYNDGVKTQGSGIFGWLATTGNPCNNGCWIQFDWSSSQLMGKIVVFNESNSNRTITGGTIQYWNGSSWVNIKTFTVAPSLSFTIEFVPVSTRSLRLSSIFTSGTQNTNPAINEIEIYNIFNNDAGIKSFEYICCNGNQPVYATVSNFGSKIIDSVWIMWQLDGISQNKFLLKKRIAPSKDTVVFLGNVNLNGNISYTLKGWTSMPNNKVDSVPSNDTILKKNYVFSKPGKPILQNQNICGCSYPLHKGKGDSNSILLWSEASNPEIIISQGDSVKDANRYCPSTTLRFVATSLNGKPDSFKQSLTQTWSITGGAANYDKGMFFDIKPSQSILLDKIFQSLTDNGNAIINTYGIEVYFKKGTYVGSENNKNAWKLIGNSKVQNTNLVSGGLAQKTVPFSFSSIRLNKDSLYSICINIVNADQWLRLNSINAGSLNVEYKNDFIKVYSGALYYNSWGSKVLFSGFAPENWLSYRIGCIGDTIHQKVKVKPLPSGVQLVKGGIFQTTLPNTTGLKNDPDIVAAYDTLSYQFTPPSGYTNANFGSKWSVNNLLLRTVNGIILPSKFYSIINPSTSVNGIVLLSLDSQWVDSTIMLNLFIGDLGPDYCDTVLNRFIYVAPRPQIRFKISPSSICDGENVFFENLSTISSGNIRYLWDFGTGISSDTSNAFSPSFKFPKYGIYDVKLKGTSVPYGYVSVKSFKVVVNEIPKANFDKSNACEGQPVVLINTTTMSIPQSITYQWDMGDGNKLTSKDVNHMYASTGGYLVSLTASSNGCSNTIFKNVYQFAKPNALFNAVGSFFCSRRAIKFENKSTISFGLSGSNWIFGDGEMSTDDDPTHFFSSEGEFNVKLVLVSEFGCKDSFSKKIVVKETPQADYINEQPCDLKPTLFVNKTVHNPLNIPLYIWSFGDSTSSQQVSPLKLWNSLGPKNVKLVAIASNGCKDSITKIITIQPKPFVDFDVFDQCSGKNVEINNKTTIKQGNLFYEWQFGDGRSSNFRVPVFQYSIGSTVTFNISLKSYAVAGCADSITKPVTITENPNCAFVFERDWTLGSRGMKFTPLNKSYQSYFWQFGDGGSSSLQTAKYKYLYDYDFPVTLTAINSAGCNCSISQNVNVNSITNISGIRNSNVRIYPAISDGVLFFDLGNIKDKSTVELFDMQGRVIYSKPIKSANGIFSIDFSFISAGFYNVSVLSGNSRISTKVLIQK